jgi:hypothetical protein
MTQLMSAAANGETAQPDDLSGPPAANRHRLPDERVGLTHHFSIAGHEGYLTVGLYPHGQPGEIFIRMAKEGSTIAGLMECFGTVVSVSLQHGVPLKGALRQALPYSVRALGLDRQRGTWLCEVDHGLPLSLDGIAISVGQAASSVYTTDPSRGRTRQRRGKPCSRQRFAIPSRQL